MCSTIPSSGGVGLRDGGRAPAAVGDGLHLDRAAPASEGAALLAARPPRRRLQRHPALARGVHRVSSRPVRRILGDRVARGLTLRPPAGTKQRYCFYSRDKIYLSPKEPPGRHSWKSRRSRRSSRSAPSAASGAPPKRYASLSRP